MGGLQSMGLRNPLALHLPIGPSQPPQLSQTAQYLRKKSVQDCHVFVHLQFALMSFIQSNLNLSIDANDGFK
jgi:hypothetical protein